MAPALIWFRRDLRLADNPAWQALINEGHTPIPVYIHDEPDADLANNTMGWQWCAGCGADAAPFFRIFNPVLQGEKFDSEGHYIRRWIPELARLGNRHLHKPWTAAPSALAAAGVTLGKDYPEPVVDLQFSRTLALNAWDQIRQLPVG